jgi:SAM-dependent methyltransferase
MDFPEIYEQLEKAAVPGHDLYQVLRSLPVDTVGATLLGIPDQYPMAQAALPSMPPDKVQMSWTGNSGWSLLLLTCAFVRALENGFVRHLGKRLEDKTILDYGCGWGRMIRLMYKFTAPENIYACDPWDKSIELCQTHGLKGHFSICDYVPKDSPFPGVQFDLIYAFSVFTHLSEKTAFPVLAACRKAIAKDGILAITIRPLSYWDVENPSNANVDRERIKRTHREQGFAFSPHARKAGEEATYGDASITLEYIQTHWTDWVLAGIDVCIQDPYQTIVFLRPA